MVDWVSGQSKRYKRERLAMLIEHQRETARAIKRLLEIMATALERAAECPPIYLASVGLGPLPVGASGTEIKSDEYTGTG